MRRLQVWIFLLCLCFFHPALALYTELGLSYNYMKRTFSELDKIENQGTTASISFYVWDRIALELSYTNGLYVKKEKELSLSSSTAQRTTTQYTDIYETNLIYVFADKKATFQPFVKGGAAYIKKRQVVQIDNDVPFEVSPSPGWAPSYGAGLKILISDAFAIRGSYDAVRTPIDDSNSVDDITGRVGVSWIF
jgi:hypothetical protein